MNQMEDGIQEHLNKILSKYLCEPLNESILRKIEGEVNFVLFSLLEDSCYTESISIKVFQNNCGNITVQPDNLFTLMYIHTGKIPPSMFMPNEGIEKDEFDWDGFKYYFVYDTNLDLYIPKIKEI